MSVWLQTLNYDNSKIERIIVLPNRAKTNLYYFRYYNKHTFISVCPMDYISFACPNYPECIPMGKICDDNNDCGDNSDESASIC